LLFSFFFVSCTEKKKNIPSCKTGIIDLRAWNFERDGIVPLNGEWEFYWNELTDNQGLKSDSANLMTVPDLWNRSGKYPAHGFATYQLHLKISKSEDLLFLKLKTVSTAYILSVNGKKLAQVGKLSRKPNEGKGEYRPLFIPLILSELDTQDGAFYKLDLQVQVSNYHHSNSGLWETVYLGRSEQIKSYWQNFISIKLILLGLILAMALYHLGVFLLRRSDYASLYFSFISGMMILRNITTDEIVVLEWLSIDFQILTKIEYGSAYLIPIFIALFTRALFRKEMPKLAVQIVVGIGVFIAASILFFPLNFYSQLKIFYNLYIFLSGIYVLTFVLWKSMMRRREGAILAFGGLFVLYAAALVDMLTGQSIIQLFYIADFGLLVYVIFQSYLLSKLFASTFNKNKDLTQQLNYQNINLEGLVRERTAEIFLQKEELVTQSENLATANSNIQQQHDKIKAQNELIKRSITYAQTIQEAILPLKENMDKHFQSFVLFKPKDIVSGDFYWFTHLPAGKGKAYAETFVAVLDCTGHGVPGAFMSMIGSRLLNEIVNEQKVSETNQILELLNQGVKKALKQEQTQNQDGMDVCLCKIIKNKSDFSVHFSGAKRPLWIYKKESNKILRIKGDKKTVGGKYFQESVFTKREMKLQAGDTLYLFSDGYIDQNGADRKKIGSQNLFKYLEELAPQNLETQMQVLEDKLDTWKGKEEQRDDITIMGVRL